MFKNHPIVKRSPKKIDRLSAPSKFSSLIGATLEADLKASRCHDFLTYFYSTTNIGDDIQTIAQLGFIPPGADIQAVDRDLMHTYKIPTRRILIANGWYSHNWRTWPMPANVDPVFVSVHISNKRLLHRQEVIEYLKQHAPIGCRDEATVRLLHEHGVDAYFTGCMTLTLNNPFSEADRTDRILIADAHLPQANTYPPGAADLMKSLVPSRVLENADVLEHEITHKQIPQTDWRIETTEHILEQYAKAKLVITSRLHCALPCLALGTPVVFLHENYAGDIRFDGLRDYLQGYGPNCAKIDFDWDNPVPTDISPIRTSIENTVRDAVIAKLKA